MKIAEAIIRNKNISEHNEYQFEATYKGKHIIISSFHNLGKPKYSHLTRFNIDVVDIKTGLYDVQTYEDCHDIRWAIRVALIGAKLIFNPN